jgi:ABC-type antimicrobial peptide transport system permease subunit
MGVPRGVTGIPLVVPVAITGALVAGSALLGLVTGGVSARLALRASPAGAMRDAT